MANKISPASDAMPKAAEAAYAPKANPTDPLALKKEGNDHFKRGAWEAAAKCYTAAIDLWMEPKDRAVLYANRSAARLKQSPEPGCTASMLAESALRDAERAIELEATFAKGHFRRAQALSNLRRHADAAVSLRRVLALSPGDAAAQALLQDVEGAAAKAATATEVVRDQIVAVPASEAEDQPEAEAEREERRREELDLVPEGEGAGQLPPTR